MFCRQRNYYFMPFIDEMSAKIFGPDYPRASELESKTVLALVNSHPALDFPEVLPPNVYVLFKCKPYIYHCHS